MVPITRSVTLKSQKSLLTRYSNTLERILKENENIIKADPDNGMSKQVTTLEFQLKGHTKLLVGALESFTATCDSLAESLSGEDQEQVNDYITKAHNVLELAQTAIIALECNHTAPFDHAQVPLGTQYYATSTTGEIPVAQTALPPIPIPSFTGKVWDFQNFWTLFAANVHNQPLTKLQKFNYLQNALQGEALQTIRRYPVTEDNYDHAVNLLHAKYGDETKFIACLQSRLERARAENTMIPAQRRLLELLILLVTQLIDKGVPLDGSFLVQKLLSKFSVDLQRKVLRRRMNPPLGERTWIMKEVLSDLDDIISMEEKINDMLHYKEDNGAHSFSREDQRSSAVPALKGQCMFCGSGDHKSMFCRKYNTIEERRTVFREHNRCLNCALPGHFVKQCPKMGCKVCNGKKHHFTLCPKRNQQSDDTEVQSSQGRSEHVSVQPARNIKPQSTSKPAKQAPLKKQKQAQTNLLEAATCGSEAVDIGSVDNSPKMVLSYIKDEGSLDSEKENLDAEHKVFLLTGVARVRDSIRNTWKEVEVLLDTGADQSFISKELAEELGLVCKAQRKFIMYTFGTETPRQATCGETMLGLWDHEGVEHEFHLYTTPVLTAQNKIAQLDNSDLEYIARHNIALSRKNCGHCSKPQILLGCDQLWSLLDVPYPHHTLPSGLQLVPSRLGYLLTGRQIKSPSLSEQVGRSESDVKISVNSFTNFDEELERWDKYWTMDSAGVCEFTGTRNAEKDATNEKVAKFFEETIEKRNDGYYIRFPYKENHPPLPTNKAIALKRLRTVLETLRKTPQLLHDYDETFRSQQEKGIIEEIADSSLNEGAVVHYIPHQPVLTPNKETTKLRIVFDASTHFRDSPSLNDVLHQGPLILPELYAMLLRFRLPKYVITSDVEKAFLQVRLHEADRDATRFLWVRKVDVPFHERNIRTFRFTRVTFGLNVSPYLLGATIHHHLRHAVENMDLANEIRENLYVDNLILSADTPTEAIEKSLESRRIFEEMGMNLREFLSNEPTLWQGLPEAARAKSTTQKVLGISWNTNTDCLEAKCFLTQHDVITKRTVTRQIASIYDPLGWLVPLLIPAKKFQQDLWRQKYQWDTELPLETTNKWIEIIGNMNGFQKVIPRRYCANPDTLNLAVFADASEVAIAACAYLFNKDNSMLTMAKSKLQSIKTRTTMPKLEMNALTLATRLALSVAQALKLGTFGHSTTIYIFSDSQIALSWVSSARQTNLGVLVENRLREIRRIIHQLENETISVTFGYVNTSENPADAGTRGLNAEQIINHNWWTGPTFLRTAVQQWPTPFYNLATDNSPTVPTFAETIIDKTVTVNRIQTGDVRTLELLDWSRFGSLTAAKRTSALTLRFLKKLLRNQDESLKARVLEHVPELKSIRDSTNPLEGSEIRAAKLALVRNHQLVYVTKDYRKSMENTLRLYQDENEIWRSKGRLGHSALNDNAKSPIFIAPNTAIAQKIIQEAHGPYHKGIEHTIATVREQFWIPKLRQQVRTVTKQCIQCRRFNALPYHYPDTPDLPSRRVLRCRPFQHTGLDFFDLPMCFEKDEKYKLYGCIFTCAVTRLIHLEVVRSTATKEFINALRRFIARKGLPESITCDNAPTFLLSANILENQNNQINEEILSSLTNKEIQWKHITPYAPWQGGFYERLIKTIKQSIYKTLRGGKPRSFDDIQTFVAEVEACLNTRPLTYQASEQEVMTSIRPIDFLQKDVTLTLAMNKSSEDDSDYFPTEESRMMQYRHQVVDALLTSCQETELFWKVWQTNYLTSLREKHKRLTSNRRLGCETPIEGDVVLVNDPVLPRNDWKMARITKINRGADGEIRDVELLTANRRKIRRPVNLLIPLEIQESRKFAQSPTRGEISSGDSARTAQTEESRYNLRPRPVRQVRTITVPKKQSTTLSPRWFLFHLMLVSLLRLSSTAEVHLNCRRNRVKPHTSPYEKLRIRAESLDIVDHCLSESHHVKTPVTAIANNYKIIFARQSGEQTKGFYLREQKTGSHVTTQILPSTTFELWDLPRQNILKLKNSKRSQPSALAPTDFTGRNNPIQHEFQIMESHYDELKQVKRINAALQQGLEEYQHALRKQKQDMKKLRSALPPLPPPKELYNNIIARCRHFHDCTEKMKSLETRIRNLRTSKIGWSTRFHELELLEVICDQTRLDFQFTRYQLRTLFRAPPLLIATGAISEVAWNTWMEQEQLNDDDSPLLVNMEVIEAAASDQLQLLDGHRLALSDIRAGLQEEENRQTASFQETVTQALQTLQSSVEALQITNKHVVPPAESPHDQSADTREEEDLPKDPREDEIIRGNEEFTEGVSSDLEADGIADEGTEDSKASSRAMIEEEIRELHKVKSDYLQTIDELQAQPSCPPRRFEFGEIRKERETTMRCAFCDAIGEHYSDSCYEVQSAEERRHLIHRNRRCIMCLEFCPGGKGCRKYYARCYHCRNHGHHSALCWLPEKTEEVLDELTYLRNELERCENRLQVLEKDLRLLN